MEQSRLGLRADAGIDYHAGPFDSMVLLACYAEGTLVCDDSEQELMNRGSGFTICRRALAVNGRGRTVYVLCAEVVEEPRTGQARVHGEQAGTYRRILARCSVRAQGHSTCEALGTPCPPPASRARHILGASILTRSLVPRDLLRRLGRDRLTLPRSSSRRPAQATRYVSSHRPTRTRHSSFSVAHPVLQPRIS